MSPLPEPPFFIVGHPRSGTTLLRFMLSSHSRLHVPEETGFIPFLGLKPGPGQILSLEKVEATIVRIEKRNHLWKGLVPNIDELYKSLPTPTPAHLLDALYRRQIEARDKVSRFQRWGDKTPGYINYIPLLAGLFPQAQFIHIVRDGRDAALSAREKWPERSWYMSLYYLLTHWVENVTTGHEDGKNLEGGRYLQIRYETLVHSPEAELRRVCAFLDETYEEVMLNHTKLARSLGPGPQEHTEVQHEISTSSVGRWRHELDPFMQKMADHVAGPTLEVFGYSLANAGHLTSTERVRLLAAASHFRFLNGLRTLLYKTGILTLNRGMRHSQR